MANVLKIWWATKFLTRNLMDSSYISHLRDSTPSFFLHPYLIIDRMIVNSVAKVQSGCVKNWHRRRKDEEGRLNWRWNTEPTLKKGIFWIQHDQCGHAEWNIAIGFAGEYLSRNCHERAESFSGRPEKGKSHNTKTDLSSSSIKLAIYILKDRYQLLF